MDKIYKWVIALLIVSLVGLFVYGHFRVQSLNKKIREKENELIKTTETVELWKGMYAKKAQQVDFLTVENGELAERLKETKQQLIAQTEVNIVLVGEVKRVTRCVSDGSNVIVKGLICRPEKPASPNPDIPPGATVYSLSNTEDFGMVKTQCDANVYVWKDGSNPYRGDMAITLLPGKPLKLDLFISRDPEGRWTTYATTKDPNVKLEIGTNKMSISPLTLRWYEKIGIHLDLGVGTGVLGGVGVNYELGNIRFGPSVWGVAANGGSGAFYGVNLDWNPFKRDENK